MFIVLPSERMGNHHVGNVARYAVSRVWPTGLQRYQTHHCAICIVPTFCTCSTMQAILY